MELGSFVGDSLLYRVCSNAGVNRIFDLYVMSALSLSLVSDFHVVLLGNNAITPDMKIKMNLPPPELS